MQRTYLRAKESRDPIHLPLSHEDRGRTRQLKFRNLACFARLQRAVGEMHFMCMYLCVCVCVYVCAKIEKIHDSFRI